MEIYLVRHGLSEANEKMILQGQIDFPLSHEGRRQARYLGLYFKSRGIRFDRAVTSNLSRAKETAMLILEQQEKPPLLEEDENFREIDIGSLQGFHIDEVTEKFPTYYQRGPDKWLDFSEYGGESWNLLCERVDSSMPLYAPDDNLLDSCKFLMVAHGGVLRAMIRYLMATDSNFMFLRMENCCHVKISYLMIRGHLRRYIEYILPLGDLIIDGETYNHDLSDEHRANLVS